MKGADGTGADVRQPQGAGTGARGSEDDEGEEKSTCCSAGERRRLVASARANEILVSNEKCIFSITMSLDSQLTAQLFKASLLHLQFACAIPRAHLMKCNIDNDERIECVEMIEITYT